MVNNAAASKYANYAQITAKILLDTGAVLIRPDDPFTLTSGKKSPVYVDCRKLIAFPNARDKLMNMAASIIQEEFGFDHFDQVAGGETAGIAYAAFLAERLHLPMAYIRKKPKGFGRNARIEGDLKPDQNVLLVEDMATDGGSKLSFVDGIREAGAICNHCFVVFHYGIFPEGTARLKDAGVSMLSLATWEDVYHQAQTRGEFSAPTLAKLRQFLDAPNDWQG